MKEGYSELIEYLDKKFTGFGDRFTKIDERLNGVDFHLDHIDKRFDGVDRELATIRDEVGKLYGGIDAYAKKADSYFQEMVMLAHKVDRHEKWLQQLAEKLGVKLDF